MVPRLVLPFPLTSRSSIPFPHTALRHSARVLSVEAEMVGVVGVVGVVVVVRSARVIVVVEGGWCVALVAV